MFFYIVCKIIIQLTAFYPRKIWIESYCKLFYTFMYKFTYNNTNIIGKKGQQFKIIEYSLLLLFIITGGTLVISCSDIVSIFLCVELQSYGLYLLATLYKDSESSTSAGLTYFLLGGLSSCFILLGTSLLYANSGTTSLDGYYVITGVSNVSFEYLYNLYNYLYINICLLIMSMGFLFKISGAPFHFWSPYVYDAIPTIVTTFVAITAKISILAFLLELVHYTTNLLFTLNFSWVYSLLLSSFLSLIVGSVLGLSQTRIKRLFAYSTISHLGFILLTIIIYKAESIQSFAFYITQYTISNINAFFILIAIGYTVYPFFYKQLKKSKYIDLLEKNNSPIQITDEIKGYFYLNPLLAVSLSITLFSFAGIPPLVGFFSKQMVLSTALDSGFIFFSLIAILTSVISAAYYLNLIKQIFFSENKLQLHEFFRNAIYYCKVTPYINNTNKTKFTINNIRVFTYITIIIIIFTFSLIISIFTLILLLLIRYCIITPYTNNKFILENIRLSTYMTLTISIFTLTILLFMFSPNEWLSTTRLLSLLIFNP